MDISQIIKYEGPNDVLVWKHPTQDFNTTSQLIVHESQEAILFRNGQALDLFGAGRYTLETENIPLLRRIINIPTGGKTPFHCEVYFINKVDCMDVLWGTATPVPVQDPVYNIILPVRANGQFAIRVEESRRFLVKIVGTTAGITKEGVNNYFRGLLMTRIKDYIATMMTQRKISFLDVHSYLNEISDHIKQEISGVFADYGITVVNFFVNSITVPQDDPGFVKIRNALASAKERELLAKGKRAEMDIVGYSYQQERTYDVLDKAAQNEGTGSNMMGLSMGLGMGLPIGGMVGKAMGGAMENVVNAAQSSVCPKCNATLPANAKFCLACGAQIMQDSAGIVCPACNHSTPRGKFCMHCGAKLENACKKCGASLLPGAKFCPECGEEQ